MVPVAPAKLVREGVAVEGGSAMSGVQWQRNSNSWGLLVSEVNRGKDLEVFKAQGGVLGY